jgi:polyisoprenoid-binding protein YceI
MFLLYDSYLRSSDFLDNNGYTIIIFKSQPVFFIGKDDFGVFGIIDIRLLTNNQISFTTIGKFTPVASAPVNKNKIYISIIDNYEFN